MTVLRAYRAEKAQTKFQHTIYVVCLAERPCSLHFWPLCTDALARSTSGRRDHKEDTF
jgi:hypothetical protein